MKVEVITEEEVDWAIKKSKGGKAAGRDDVVAEFIKDGGKKLKKVSYHILAKILEKRKVLQDWRKLKS